MNEIGLVRPHFSLDREFHSHNLSDVTVLICQRQTPDLIKLALESLLNWYPDISILIVDGNSQDDSTLYIKWKTVTHPNVKLVELTPEIAREKDIPISKDGINSHGATMNYAIRTHIKTKYVLLLDSDVIIERGGFIEHLKQCMIEDDLYAAGTLMLVSRANEGCAPPRFPEDTIRYAHPSCSLYNAQKYLNLKPFNDHGAPCIWNMISAADTIGYGVGYFPIDKYVSHLSGASWCNPQTIWDFDHNVKLRPFVTFITDKHVEQLLHQTDHDFDIVTSGKLLISGKGQKAVVLHSDEKKIEINNRLYSIRFAVHGEYVCHLNSHVESISENFVNLVKLKAIEMKAPEEMLVGGLVLHRRSYWQNKICLA